ncbi:MAG: AIM24 family protein [Acidimicrobiia bacterium]|nr:AIM24 family protein [Acidimicrobiia bacterium]
MRSDIFSHVEQQVQELGFVLQNSKMLKATINGNAFFARRGAMVAYQGQTRFEYQGITSGEGSMKDKMMKAAKGATTGEGVPLMKVSGQAEVFLADESADIFLIDLDGSDALSINGSNVLAFSETLSYDIKMLTNAGVFAGAGLFNTFLTGTGRVAITSKGTPLVLDCSQQPTYVDPNAAICWAANLQVQMQRSEGMGGLIGRSSGEHLQMMFHGPGFVVVQPHENRAGVGPTGTENQGGVGGALGNILGGR